MTTVFHYVRHASHGHLGRFLTGRLYGVGISAQGREQAADLARDMAALRIDAIFTSPRLRARQTAAHISEATGTAAAICRKLDEIDFGRWEGRSFSELEREPEWRQWNRSRDTAATPSGATMAEVADRQLELLERLRPRFPGGSVCLVSHGDVIKAAICRLRGLPFQAVHDIEIAPASVTTVAFRDHGACVTTPDELALPSLEEVVD